MYADRLSDYVFEHEFSAQERERAKREALFDAIVEEIRMLYMNRFLQALEIEDAAEAGEIAWKAYRNVKGDQDASR